MIFNLLSSSSAGNSIVIKDYRVLLDIGISYKMLEPHINEFDYVFITHIHGDHLKKSTVRRVARERPLVKFIIGYYLLGVFRELGLEDRAVIVEANQVYELANGIRISPFDLYHDVENMGLRIFKWSEEEDRYIKTFFATDTGTLEGITAKDYDYYLIEGNYCEHRILEVIEEIRARGGYIQRFYRTMEMHLSKQQRELFIAQNDRYNNGLHIELHRSDETYA